MLDRGLGAIAAVGAVGAAVVIMRGTAAVLGAGAGLRVTPARLGCRCGLGLAGSGPRPWRAVSSSLLFLARRSSPASGSVLFLARRSSPASGRALFLATSRAELEELLLEAEAV